MLILLFGFGIESLLGPAALAGLLLMVLLIPINTKVCNVDVQSVMSAVKSALRFLVFLATCVDGFYIDGASFKISCFESTCIEIKCSESTSRR
jgi:hypothetical protein